MIVVVYNFSADYMLGFWIGIASALLAALFSVLNKEYLDLAGPGVITFYEMFSAFMMMSLLMLFVHSSDSITSLIPTIQDLTLLIVLALFCTILPFILHLIALRKLSAFTTNLIVNLEPVYGILLAALLLNEYAELDLSFYIGGTLIVILVLIYPYVKMKFRQN